jgi:hypothetical protein
LLELLFAMSLMTVILISFAAVYPSGYRLNRKSAKGTVASKTAQAVAAELLSLPVFDDRPPGSPGTIFTLAAMGDAVTGQTQIQQYVSTSLKTQIPPGYIVRPQGIVVWVSPASSDPTPLFARIQVTIYWPDSQNVNIEHSVSIVTAKTDNQVNR